MKKTHIIIIGIIAVAIAAIMTMYGDASTYETFDIANKNPEREYHVVGVLNKEKEMYYDPHKDPNFFSFYLIDEKGSEQKVVYHNPEPADFERSEKIVIIGKSQGDQFVASKILLKCPSKYNENQINT